MTIEDVEGHPTEHCIAQGGYLLELVGRSCLVAGTIPGTPFVYDELDVVLLVKFAHDLPVAGDEAFHSIAFAQEFIPVDRVELESVSFALDPILGGAAAQIPGIVMKRHTVDRAQLSSALLEDFFQEAAGPVPVVHIRTRCDE